MSVQDLIKSSVFQYSGNYRDRQSKPPLDQKELDRLLEWRFTFLYPQLLLPPHQLDNIRYRADLPEASDYRDEEDGEPRQYLLDTITTQKVTFQLQAIVTNTVDLNPSLESLIHSLVGSFHTVEQTRLLGRLRLAVEWAGDIAEDLAFSVWARYGIPQEIQPSSPAPRWNVHEHKDELFISSQYTVVHPVHGQLGFWERHLDCAVFTPIRFGSTANAEKWIASGTLAELQESLSILAVGFSRDTISARTN